MGAVSCAKDEESALRTAIERAAEALQAEVGAAVFLTVVRASIGFPKGQVPEGDLVAVAEGREDRIDVPGAGDCHAIAVPLEVQPPGWMVLARSSKEFNTAELVLLRGMARVLALVQRMMRVVDGERSLREKTVQQSRQNAQLLASLQERQRLLERLMAIQRLISLRTPPDRVFEVITAGVQELLGDEVVAIRLVDEAEPGCLVTVSSSGMDPGVVEATQHSPVGAGAGGRAIAEERLIVIEDYADSPDSMEDVAGAGIQAAMAAPVHEHGTVIGCLIVGSYTAGRKYSRADQDVVLAFAEQASLALPEAVREGRSAVHG
jgi:GAF domain-containing protein